MGQYKTVHSPCDCLQHSRRGHFSSSEQEDSQHCHGLVIVPPCRRLPLLLPCRVLLKSSANGSFLSSIEKEEVTNPSFDWKLHISASQKRFVENQFALILFYNLTWVLDYAFVFLPRLHWCIDHTCTKVYISLFFFLHFTKIPHSTFTWHSFVLQPITELSFLIILLSLLVSPAQMLQSTMHSRMYHSIEW